jgi:type VI secretion system protein ImpC
VLNVNKKELLKDLQKAPEFDQSALFKKVYEEEFGVFGGAVRRADRRLRVRPHGQDIELLEKIAGGGGCARAVHHGASSPRCSTSRSFTQLDAPRDLAKIFDTTEYAKWKAFRDSTTRATSRSPRRACCCASRTAGTPSRRGLRLRGGRRRRRPRQVPVGQRGLGAGRARDQAFAPYGWCATIRGVESGGLVEGLPVHNFRTDEGRRRHEVPDGGPITDRREKELADLGFVPLVHCKGTPNAAFFSVQSAQKPKIYDKDAATANARLSRSCRTSSRSRASRTT